MTKNYNLNFISDDDLYSHVKETLTKFDYEMDLKRFNKNIIDPIKMTFDKSFYQLDDKALVQAEVNRQVDKNHGNLIGYFHQNIFKYFSDDWDVPLEGFDIVNDKEKIFIELKNKHNTMNSSSSQKTFMRMQNKLIEDPEAKCYLVEVIAKKGQDIQWAVSLDKEPISNPKIRRMSIDRLYKLVTGDENSFKNLCETLPIVIKDVIEQESLSANGNNTVLKELYDISPNILQSMYLEAFKTYYGFENFKI